MYKRMSIRIVTDLSDNLNAIAKKRGLSINSLISEMAWDFVEDWKAKYDGRFLRGKCPNPINSVGVNRGTGK